MYSGAPKQKNVGQLSSRRKVRMKYTKIHTDSHQTLSEQSQIVPGSLEAILPLL